MGNHLLLPQINAPKCEMQPHEAIPGKERMERWETPGMFD